MNTQTVKTPHWSTLALALAGVLTLWAVAFWPVMGYGAHPTRVPVTDQTTDVPGTDLNASLFGSLQSNVESDIENHGHTGGADGKVLLSTALVSLNLNQIGGTLDSSRISPPLQIGRDLAGALTSGQISPALTFPMIGGTLDSSQFRLPMNLNSTVAGNLESSRLTGSVVNSLGSSGPGAGNLTGNVRLECRDFIRCDETSSTVRIRLTSIRTQTMLLTAAGGSASTQSGSTAPTKLNQTLTSTDFWGIGLASVRDTSAFWNVVLPNAYTTNGLLSYRVIWYTTGGAANESVTFGLRARAYPDGSGINDGGGTILGGAVEQFVWDTYLGLNSIHRTQLASIPTTIVGTPQGGSYATFYLRRRADAGSLRSEAWVLGVEVLYPVNAFGDQ